MSRFVWWLSSGLLALVLTAVSIPTAVASWGVPVLVAFAAGLAQAAALLLIRPRPRTATVLQFVATAVVAVAISPQYGQTWPLTIPGMLILIVHMVLLTLRIPWRRALTVWGASVALVALAALLDPYARPVEDATAMLVLYPSNSLVILGATLGIKHWAGIRQQLAEARRDVVIEQGQRALVEERTRIARELHDVVAHSMSVIHMQATSASYRLKDLDPEVKEEFARIAAGARATMAEMRQLLALLRDESAEAARAPVPDLNRVAELVESARAAGLEVELHNDVVDDVRDAVGLTAYRIVQESLSNVIRHAPGARTEIVLKVEEVDLVVVVVNERSAQPAQLMETAGRAGHGLAGMQERVRLVGGTLETGPLDSGGYRVAARLPLAGDEQ